MRRSINHCLRTTWDRMPSKVGRGEYDRRCAKPHEGDHTEPDDRAAARSQAGKMRRPLRSIARLAPTPRVMQDQHAAPGGGLGQDSEPKQLAGLSWECGCVRSAPRRDPGGATAGWVGRRPTRGAGTTAARGAALATAVPRCSSGAEEPALPNFHLRHRLLG